MLLSSRDMDSNIRAVWHRPSTGENQSKPKLSSLLPGNRLCYYHNIFGEAAQRYRQPCTWSGKQWSQLPLAALVVGHNNGLLFLSDSVQKWQSLVDTGTEVRVLPATALETCRMPPGPLLLSTNGTAVRTYRMHTLSIHFESNMLLMSHIPSWEPISCVGQHKWFVSSTSYHSVALPLSSLLATKFSNISMFGHPCDALHVCAEFPNITVPNFIQLPTKQNQTFYPPKGTCPCMCPPPMFAHRFFYDDNRVASWLGPKQTHDI